MFCISNIVKRHLVTTKTCTCLIVRLQGEWKPQRITNPDWFEDLTPYKMTPIVSAVLC